MDGRRRLDLLAPSDPAVERIWRDLEAHARPSYFLSWGWVSNWLAALPEDHRPSLAVMHDGHEPNAAFFLAQRRVRRNLVLQSNALYFNATGSPKHDELGIANNGMLARPGARRSLAHVLEQLPTDWDELHVPAVDNHAFDDFGAPAVTRYKVRVDREHMAPFVALDTVRRVDGGYDALLPVTTRARLQQTRHHLASVDVEVAADRAHAADIYDELLRLHAREAAARRQRGAFAETWVEAFHRRLIIDRIAHGEIQLMRVRSGGTTLGCLYNFVYAGRVHSYQGGFSTLHDANVEPALITHAAAVAYNAASGHDAYDIQDEALATGTNRLVWLTIHRPLGWVSLEDTARRWYEAIVGEREPQLQVA